MTQPILLIVDGDTAVYQKTLLALEKEGYAYARAGEDAVSAGNLPSCKAKLVILISSQHSVKENSQTIRKIKAQIGATPLVLVAAHGSEPQAVGAFRAGVSDYFSEQFSSRAFLNSIRKRLREPAAAGVSDMPEASPPLTAEPMIGSGPLMRDIKASITRFAPTDCTVLITGETGTGKELAAEMIHRHSSRNKDRLVCLNCAALPDSLVESELFGYRRGAFTGAVSAQKGKFEQASGGTLLLDEIGDMSLPAQTKILRTIENKTVYPLSAHRPVQLDVRVIAATNQDPEQLVAEGKFRRDLYYRLNVARIHLPPLRERKEDIPQLVHHGLAHLNLRFRKNVSQVAEAAMKSFYLYDWPGNIRELRNLLEIAHIHCSNKRIEFSDLPPLFTKKLNFQTSGDACDRDRLLMALTDSQWNKSMAAKKLNWSRMRVYRTLNRYKLTPS